MPETLTDAQKVLRNDTGKRIAVALEALASEVEPSTVIAPEYDETQTYAVGDLVIYRSVLYRCTTAITTPEEWTAAHWTATSVSDAYRQAIDQNVIDANLMALGLTGASVGDLVRVASVDANGKPTSWNRVPLCDIVTNENLLDNWYFVGGGSQQGGGQFPINQRGLTTYPNADFSIDRWKNTSGTLSISQNGISLSAIQQSLEKPRIVDGLNYTMSVYCSLGLLTATHSLDSSISGWQISGTLGGLWTGVRYVNGVWDVRISSNDSTVLIYAVKLEIGAEQTLAHQEGSTWVLNEIPDFTEELAKCQRYLIAFKTSSNTRSLLALGIAESASQYRAVLPTPVTMNHSNNRPVELTGTVTAGSLTASSVSSFWEENPGSITLFVNVTGATIGDVTKIMLEPGSTLTISAEL